MTGGGQELTLGLQGPLERLIGEVQAGVCGVDPAAAATKRQEVVAEQSPDQDGTAQQDEGDPVS